MTRAAHALRKRRRYARRRIAALCVQCGQPARAERSRCDACTTAQRDGVQRLRCERRAAGLCVVCATPSGSRRCRDCYRDELDRRARRAL